VPASELKQPKWFEIAEDMFRSEFESDADFRAAFPEKVNLYQELSSRLIAQTVQIHVSSTSGNSGSFTSAIEKVCLAAVQDHMQASVSAAAYEMMTDAYYSDASQGNNDRLIEMVNNYKEIA
jgi:hypothetical protein